jgi:hypothetical protein
MLNHFVFRIEFDMVQPSVEILWQDVYPSVSSVTLTALTKTKHLHDNERTTTFLVSAGRWLKQLGDFCMLPSLYARNGKFAANRKSAQGTQVSCLLTILKNDSMNLSFGYMISYDGCCHHHMNANELWLCMIALVIISE